ncbi:hypothetical protein IEQ34_020882 [Dendrobium chrysotoxum]|uniref:Uncharacterized protein n=1 Tax=Dendrobium chrysotoxum TaxID=161865 RepID=A0AAV7G217_DENCH|nr:hypothetical protein IEQ34_020882 [Dendrobium chrysotoxum]
MEISKDKEVTHERLEELGGSAMATQRSPMGKSRLHTFSFPTMNWGCQRILRCVNSVSGIDSSAPRSMTLNTQIKPQQEINALYSPVDSHPMSSQVGRLKEKEEQKNASSIASKEADVETTIPWNLRKRRPTFDAATEKEKKHYCSSMPSKSLLGKDNPGKAVMQETTVDKNDKRRKFSISLSRKEIEEDFYIFTGRKPSPKPKKRPKAMQKQLDALFPGFWLSEVTKDMYKGQINFQMPILKDKEVTSERLEELADSSTSSKLLLGKDDPGKAVMQGTVVDKNDRRKEFSISLSSKEIEEDFHAFEGAKPNPNPKMRAKIVQKKLDVSSIPWLWAVRNHKRYV